MESNIAKPEAGSSVLGLTFLLGGLTALTALAIDMSLPALPDLQTQYSASVQDVQLTLSLFLAGFAGGQFLCGPISDHYGRRSIIMLGLFLYVISSLACAVSTSLPMLVVFRLIQGAGASVGATLTRAIVRDLFSARDGSAMLSHITQVMIIAPMLAPTIGSYMLKFFGWESIFYLLAICGTIILVITWFRLPETVTRQAGHARIGHALRNYWSVVTHGRSIRYILAICFSASGLFAYVSASPFVLMEVFHVPKEHFGYYFPGPAVALLVGAIVNRKLVMTHSPSRLLKYGIYLLLAGGVLIFLMTWFAVGGVASVLIPMMVYMFGIAMVMPNATIGALAFHGRIAGSASSVIGAVQTLLSAFAAYLVGALYDNTSWSLVILIVVCASLTALVCLKEVPILESN